MDIIAAVFIGIGGVIGALMASYGFQKKHIPKGLVFAQGAFLGLGIILLNIDALATQSNHKHWDSIIIFIGAAAGGIYLLMQDLKKHYFKL
ncbi:MAG: hypothetical protein ACOC10_10485 [Bacteroidota bacterium]